MLYLTVRLIFVLSKDKCEERIIAMRAHDQGSNPDSDACELMQLPLSYPAKDVCAMCACYLVQSCSYAMEISIK